MGPYGRASSYEEVEPGMECISTDKFSNIYECAVASASQCDVGNGRIQEYGGALDWCEFQQDQEAAKEEVEAREDTEQKEEVKRQ